MTYIMINPRSWSLLPSFHSRTQSSSAGWLLDPAVPHEPQWCASCCWPWQRLSFRSALGWWDQLMSVWLVVQQPSLKIWKSMNEWEGLSHILWKTKNVWNHQPAAKWGKNPMVKFSEERFVLAFRCSCSMVCVMELFFGNVRQKIQ